MGLHELQRALDHWHSRTEDRTPNQQFTVQSEAALNPITKNLNRVRTVFSELGLPPNSDVQCSVTGSALYTKTLQDAVVAYKTFLIEYVILVELQREPHGLLFRDEAILAAKNFCQIFSHPLLYPLALEELQKRAMWGLSLAGLLLKLITDDSGISYRSAI